jgi:hypothetical protein
MKEIRACLSGFQFKELFTEHLMWDSSKGSYAIEAGDSVCEVQAVAEKKGLVVLICRPTEGTPFPGSAERKRIDREVTKLHHEHLIVFVDREQTRQVWQVPKREGGKTTGHSEVPFFKGKGVEHLARRIEAISFTLDESEKVSLIEVSARVNQALLAEKVTKKFFKEFSDQRKAFVKFLDWIEDETKRDWYCSVLLNRIMFIYFLGGKGFLPGGTKFLGQSLEKNAGVNGSDTFYTHFLLPLSFFGLGEKRGSRGRFEDQFKDVIYLNGGLFAVHSVERELGIDKQAVSEAKFGEGTKIPDAEFKKWFTYFEKWRWTLDEDKVENEGYISPHILGYIFEKYINQKQMGAYYTKEDITGYICRNTIIPRLFDMLAETGDKGKKAVRPLPVGPHPNLLNDGRGISDGEGIDRYIYPSVKQESKLPTETDFDLDQRRKRYELILSDFDAGKIEGIDDFITYNLDIEKLAVDFVGTIQDPDVLQAFYFKGLQQITVLDPTCGSGAFLFEALTILSPLYNACLSRMRYLVSKATGAEPDIVNWGDRLHFDDLDIDQSTLANFVDSDGSKAIAELRAEVERINDHPSAEYFIKKSIIVNNLFGVDIMEEAVEICKLRLFLTLIATVERDDAKVNFGVEPLPDIDFNILAGNTLVGYTSIDDIDRLWQEVELGSSTLAFEKDHSQLRSLIDKYGRVLKAWRLQQLGESSVAHISKEQVLKAVESVRPSLDEDAWRLYRTAGMATQQVKTSGGQSKTAELSQTEFKSTHEPFHWLLEFPQIEATGGFDVLVGNPPYVEYSQIRKTYQLIGLECLSSGNLYAFIIERCFRVAHQAARVGMIIQLSAFCTPRMSPFQDLWFDKSQKTHLLFFDDRPGKLFDGLEHIRVAICLGQVGSTSGTLFTTKYIKFPTAYRPHLFSTVSFTKNSAPRINGAVLKLSEPLEVSIANKLWRSTDRLSDTFDEDERDNWVYYSYGYGYWGKILTHLPFFEGEAGARSTGDKFLYIKKAVDRNVVAAVMNSSLFYWYYINSSDGHNFTKGVIGAFPFARSNEGVENELIRLTEELMSHLLTTKRRKEVFYKATGQVSYDEYFPSRSKDIIDRIDRALATHFGMTEEELQFIIEYDCKFRMSSVLESDDD